MSCYKIFICCLALVGILWVSYSQCQTANLECMNPTTEEDFKNVNGSYHIGYLINVPINYTCYRVYVNNNGASSSLLLLSKTNGVEISSNFATADLLTNGTVVFVFVDKPTELFNLNYKSYGNGIITATRCDSAGTSQIIFVAYKSFGPDVNAEVTKLANTLSSNASSYRVGQPECCY